MIGNILHTFWNKILMALISLGILLLNSNYLGATGLGSIGLIILNITIIQLISSLVSGSIVYFSNKLPLSNLCIIAYLWSLISLFIYWIINQIYPLIESTYVMDVYLLSFMLSALGIHQYVLLGKELIKTYNWIALLQSVLTIGILSYMFLVHQAVEVHSFITALYMAYGICFLLSFIYSIKHLPNVETGNWTKVFQKSIAYGFYVQAANGFQLLNYRISYFLLDAFSGRIALGYYTASVQISEGLILPGRSIATVQYARISNRDYDPYAQRITVLLTKVSFGITLLGVLILAILPSSFYEFLLGESFTSIKIIILIMALGILLQSAEIIISHYFSGTGRQQYNSYSAFIGLLLTLGFGLYLIPDYAAKGAALTALISYGGMFLYLFVLMIRKTPLTVLQFFPQKGDFRLLRRLWKRSKQMR